VQDGVRHMKRIVPERSWGLWHAEQNWNSLDEDVSSAELTADFTAAARGAGRKSGAAVF